MDDQADLDREKIQIEREKIKIEWLKAWGTVFAIAIPLVSASLTVGYSVWSQSERARIDFQLKAVDIVMNAPSPQAAVNKAAVLSALFSNQLPPKFEEALLRLYGK